MKRTFLLILVLVISCGFTTCKQDHQKGGGATTTIPQTGQGKPAEPLEPLAPLVMGINQPENPEGSSSMSSKQVLTTVYPDGTIVINNLETATEIGGSQDYAAIMKEVGGSEHFKNLLAALGLILAAWWMYRKEWEMVACILTVGACFCLFWGWLAAPIAIGLSFAASLGFLKANALTKILT